MNRRARPGAASRKSALHDTTRSRRHAAPCSGGAVGHPGRVSQTINLNDPDAVARELLRVHAVPLVTTTNEFTPQSVTQHDTPSEVRMLQYILREYFVLDYLSRDRPFKGPAAISLADLPNQAYKGHLLMIDDGFAFTPEHLRAMPADHPLRGYEERSCYVCLIEFDNARDLYLHMCGQEHYTAFHRQAYQCPSCDTPITGCLLSHLASAAHCAQRYAIFEHELFLHTPAHWAK